MGDVGAPVSCPLFHARDPLLHPAHRFPRGCVACGQERPLRLSSAEGRTGVQRTSKAVLVGLSTPTSRSCALFLSLKMLISLSFLPSCSSFSTCARSRAHQRRATDRRLDEPCPALP